MIKAEDFIIEHRRITKSSPVWDLNNLLYTDGTKVYRNKKNWRKELSTLPISNDRIWLIKEVTEYLNGLLETGTAVATVKKSIEMFANFVSFIDQNSLNVSDKNELEKAVYAYACSGTVILAT